MNTADLIYQESQILPENLRAEVLDFIGYLKNRYAIQSEPVGKEAIFEKNKLHNFIHSSKLEGIEINYNSHLKMADVLNKYRVSQ
jgi:hypothetical protein